MTISTAILSDHDESIERLAEAFAQDPITGFLLRADPGYRERVANFFSLLMRARIALGMPVLVARSADGVHGAVMGYATVHPDWPADLSEEWDRFEKSIPGMTDRMAVYEGIAAKFKPAVPHYYLGVIGVDPRLQGRGLGKQLLDAFCALSDDDKLSGGVYLETAQQSNVGFYERCGFEEVGRGSLGSATLWCMYRPRRSQ
jgi:ribosomal protein S18 acetylase RimI-like enzyme